MNITKHNPLNTKLENLEKNKLAKIIRDWVGNHKKIFWKYEVSCFYKTYTIRIANLPEPSAQDITVSSINRMLTVQQKKQLSDIIIKAGIKTDLIRDQYFDLQIDYVDGTVITEIL